ncbi:HupE/UreJ family protein [Neptunicoccus cionae]|uniref:Membrane protein n=1 Tax=Neptunicoccus cionae TaxID=2035344 RepID=A0A916VQY4_9RHOB|nr:HupE/UreJ family protein [Amylibacter cionae]GGA19858.1 membrane protein [Amylibacter cionae]
MTFPKPYSALLLLATLAAFFISLSPLRAHEATPSIIDMALNGSEVTLSINTNLEAIIAGVADESNTENAEAGEEEYLRLRETTPEELAQAYAALRPAFDPTLRLSLDGTPVDLRYVDHTIPPVGDPDIARVSTLTYSATLPSASGTLTWDFPADYGDSVLRVSLPDTVDPVIADYVASGATATVDLDNIAPQSTGEVVWDYIVAGFDHIIPKGLDHILFVIGLFLLSAHLRPLLMQVTMFTLAHTITLALGALGWVNVPGSIVEPLIAASIVFVAVENIFTEKLTAWRPFLIFGFGLLHGLGFASVLGDFGLPTAQFIPALIAFNIGVEIGQLAVIAICFLAVGIWFRNKQWYHSRIVVPASAAIAIMATYWVLERTALIA